MLLQSKVLSTKQMKRNGRLKEAAHLETEGV